MAIRTLSLVRSLSRHRPLDGWALNTRPNSDVFNGAMTEEVERKCGHRSEQTGYCSSERFRRYASQSWHEIYYTLRVESALYKTGTKGSFCL